MASMGGFALNTWNPNPTFGGQTRMEQGLLEMNRVAALATGRSDRPTTGAELNTWGQRSGGSGIGASSVQSPDQISAAVKSLLGNISQPAPGQDIYSQALAGMSTGKFSPTDPSYQWRLQQGQQAVERSAAAKGLLGSGNVLTALTDYAQGAASQEYSAQFSRLLAASQNATSQYDSAINAFARMAGIDLGQQAQNLAVKSEADQYTLGLGHLGVSQGQLGLQQSQFGYQKALQSGKDQAAADALASYSSNPSSSGGVANASLYKGGGSSDPNYISETLTPSPGYTSTRAL